MPSVWTFYRSELTERGHWCRHKLPLAVRGLEHKLRKPKNPTIKIYIYPPLSDPQSFLFSRKEIFFLFLFSFLMENKMEVKNIERNFLLKTSFTIDLKVYKFFFHTERREMVRSPLLFLHFSSLSSEESTWSQPFGSHTALNRFVAA